MGWTVCSVSSGFYERRKEVSAGIRGMVFFVS